MTLEHWAVRRYQHSPDLAQIFSDLHDSHFTGRVMLHVSEGTVISVETCERTIAAIADDDIPASVLFGEST